MLAATFGRLGIVNGMQVVVYDQDAGLHASRMWWSLKYLGHAEVALLDGGWAKWIAEGRPTASGRESRPATMFTPAVRPEMRVNIEDVQRRMTDARTLLVDARGPERFEGKSETIDKVAGHIPGARNHFYKWNLDDDGTMRSADELRARYNALLDGRAPGDVVMYCGSGVSACHNLLAMEHAGLTGTAAVPRIVVGMVCGSDPAGGNRAGQNQGKRLKAKGKRKSRDRLAPTTHDPRPTTRLTTTTNVHGDVSGNAGSQSVWSTLKEAVRGSHLDYTEAPIGRAVILLAVPMVLEMLMESVFAVADIFFVGRLGADAVATVGLTESLMFVVYALAIGVAIGAAATVARRIGEKDPDRAAAAAVQAIILGGVVAVVLGTIGAMFGPQLIRAMGASDAVIATDPRFRASCSAAAARSRCSS